MVAKIDAARQFANHDKIHSSNPFCLERGQMGQGFKNLDWSDVGVEFQLLADG